MQEIETGAAWKRRTFVTPWGVRELAWSKGDLSAYEYSSRYLVTSRSHPQWWLYNDAD